MIETGIPNRWDQRADAMDARGPIGDVDGPPGRGRAIAPPFGPDPVDSPATRPATETSDWPILDAGSTADLPAAG